MRIFIILILAFSLAALFALFPDVADRTMSVSAFGWVFEGKQGPFILLCLLALGGFWLLRRILLAVLAGPGHVWHVLRTGSKKRKEAHLRDGLAEWLDMRGERGWKYFRKARGFLPEWGDALLASLPQSPADIPLPKEGSDALSVALNARIATDPHAVPKADFSIRKAHLEAWLKVHPDAPLAMQRQVDLLEEAEDWSGLVAMLEKIWQRGGSSAAHTAPRLAAAYSHLAASDAERALEYMRKAHRLQPESPALTLALGRALLAAEDASACRKLWLAHLERDEPQKALQHDANQRQVDQCQTNEQIAIELSALLHDDALKFYRKFERRSEAKMTPALALLRASLAHAAELSGLADENMKKLLATYPSPQAWRMLGDWQAEAGDWQAAAESYRQACVLSDPAEG